MAKDPLVPRSPRDGDSWEDLASNLLGIDLHKTSEDDVVTEEEFKELEADLFEEEAAAADEPIVEPVDSVTEPVTQSAPETEPVTEREPTDSAEPADTYWDPLQAWQWGNEEESRPYRNRREQEPRSEPSRSRPAPRPVKDVNEESSIGKRGKDARRAAESFETVTDYRQEYEEEDGFGAGLMDAAPPEKPTSPATASSVSPSEPALPEATSPVVDEKSSTDRPEGRRRRRRRSGSRPDGSPAKPSTDSERNTESQDAAPTRGSRDEAESRNADKPRDERAVRRETSEPATAPSARVASDDDFGAGLDAATTTGNNDSADEESGQEGRRRPPRRRGRRRRRPAEGTTAAPSAQESVDDEDDSDLADIEPHETDDDTEEDTIKPAPAYRNIPTWEEAIGYLLKSGSSSANSSTGRTAPQKSGESAGNSEESSGASRSGGGRRRRPPR